MHFTKAGSLCYSFQCAQQIWSSMKHQVPSPLLIIFNEFLEWIERPVRGGGGEKIDEPGDDILTATRMLVSGIFRQLTTFVVVLDVLTKFYEDRECFLLQRKRMMSALIEIVFYWARVIISVWENESKLKETTVYTCSEHSKSVKRCARIVWASLISAPKVARQECLPHCFSPNVSTSPV